MNRRTLTVTEERWRKEMCKTNNQTTMVRTDHPQAIKRSHRILITIVLVFVLAGISGITGFMCVLVPQQNAQQLDTDYIAALRTANVGDSVFFGRYEQDNNPVNGAEAIEWQVLSKDGSRLLLVSKYALDYAPFNTGSAFSTWDYSTMLHWLNESFYTSSFSRAEQAMIRLSDVSPDRNMLFDTDPGKMTRSRVFLLSIDEANALFRTADDRQCQPTAYAASRGAVAEDDGGCGWWLRSPGYDVTSTSRVLPNGGFSFVGQPAERSLAVRPAIWVECNENI